MLVGGIRDWHMRSDLEVWQSLSAASGRLFDMTPDQGHNRITKMIKIQFRKKRVSSINKTMFSGWILSSH